MNSLDSNGDGTIDPREFETLFKKRDPQLAKDPGIRNLSELEYIDLSSNSISSLKVSCLLCDNAGELQGIGFVVFLLLK